jgi:hypothetical protein
MAYIEPAAMLGKVMFSFMLMFIWLPMLVLKFEEEDHSWLDKFFITLVHSSVFIIVIVHLLAAVHLYETISLLLLYGFGFYLISRYDSRNNKLALGIAVMVRLYDLSEDKPTFLREIRKLVMQFRHFLVSVVSLPVLLFRKHPVSYGGLLITFVIASVTRLDYGLLHSAFASTDPYVHMKWVKALSQNQFYVDGVYPYGYEAVISGLVTFFVLDDYWVIRFMGPLTHMLLMLSIVFSLRKVSNKGWTACLVAILLYAAVALLPTNTWRQLSALSMEYGAVFLLPGITFLRLYFQGNRNHYLVLAAECLFLTVIIHVYAAVILGMAYTVVLLMNITKLHKGRVFLRFAAYMVPAGLLGMLPPVIGLLLGLPFHASSVDYATRSLSEEAGGSAVHTWSERLMKFYEPNVLLMGLLGVALLFIVYEAYRKLHSKRNWPFPTGSPAMLSMSFIVVYVMYRSKELGLPSVVAADRMGVLLSLIAVLVAGEAMATFWHYIRQWRGTIFYQIAAALLLLSTIILQPGWMVKVDAGTPFQYDASVDAYQRIREDESLKLQSWNIISPVEELPLVMGHGYHTELWEFASFLKNPDKPAMEFSVPYVFLFVEKIPLGTSLRTSEVDVNAPFPQNRDMDLTEFYYRNDGKVRAYLEAVAYQWAEQQLRTPGSSISVYMETPQLKVYKLVNQGNLPVVLTK